MNNEVSNIAFELTSTLRHIGKHIRAGLAGKDCDCVISPEQFGLLDMLSQNDETIQSDLAAMLDKDKSAIMRHIDTLEEMGLVVRHADATDRRKKRLTVTEKGSELLQKGQEMVRNVMAEMLQGVPQDDLEAFRRVLSQMKANAEK